MANLYRKFAVPVMLPAADPDNDNYAARKAYVDSQLSGGSGVTAGAGLTKSGNTLDVGAGNTAISVGVDAVSLALATNSGLEIASGLKVDLDANPALVLGAGGLAVDSAIAGAGLTWTTGVMSVASANAAIAVGGDGITLTLDSESGLQTTTGLKIASTIAGNALTLTAGVLDVAVDGATIEVNTDALRVKADGIGLSHLKAAASGGVIYTATKGDGTATSIACTHNLGKQYCMVQVIEVATLQPMECQVTFDSTTEFTLTFLSAPATNGIKVIAYAGL